jgi:hypothetical protein
MHQILKEFSLVSFPLLWTVYFFLFLFNERNYHLRILVFFLIEENSPPTAASLLTSFQCSLEVVVP